MRQARRRLSWAPSALALAIAGAAGAASPAPGLDVSLKPTRDATGSVDAIEVRAVIEAGEAGKPFGLVAPIIYPGAWRVADRLKDLTVSDAQGAIALNQTDDAPVPGGFPYFRHWTAQRPVQYPVTVSYRAVVQPPGGPNGPAFGIRPSGGGVSGAGAGFLVVPEGVAKTTARLKWDLSAMPAGSVGVTSFGEGTFELEGSPAKLQQGWYMAGPVGRYPAVGHVGGFSATWLGQSDFDPVAEMTWTTRMAEYQRQFFSYLKPRPSYRVFMRFLDTPPVGGGTALVNSFMLSKAAAPRDPKAVGPRETFAHEMQHAWTGDIDGPDGVVSWFTEGLTVYYTTKLMFRGGFDNVDDYGQTINHIAEGYWASPAWNWSAAEIAKAGFGDEKVRHVPYNRGALYFADLDSRLRAKSGGKRNLDTVVREMFLRREAGERFDQDKWVALIEKDLGPEARPLFEAVILRGEALTPASDAFGPCFRRQAKAYASKTGAVVDGFEWVRVPGVSETACRKA